MSDLRRPFGPKSDPITGEEPCPECGEDTPALLLYDCIHSDRNPLCPTCCQIKHIGKCSDCFGHGSIFIWGTGRSVVCATCEGEGTLL